jgi:hypothetical protein
VCRVLEQRVDVPFGGIRKKQDTAGTQDTKKFLEYLFLLNRCRMSCHQWLQFIQGPTQYMHIPSE